MKLLRYTLYCFALISLWSGYRAHANNESRLAMFVGIDISGSYMNSKNFDDSLEFLSNYLYMHLEGIGELERPKFLFVGPIGGVHKDEAKTLFPIETFQHRTPAEILVRLKEIFNKKKQNPYTDFNSFFDQIAEVVKARKLVLRPISIVMLSDGKPDAPAKDGKKGYRAVNFKNLEKLSRNITVRLLYTDAVTGAKWQKEVPRRRVRIWTQDAAVMRQWKDPKIFEPKKAIKDKERFINWIKNNVDTGVRAQRVD